MNWAGERKNKYACKGRDDCRRESPKFLNPFHVGPRTTGKRKAHPKWDEKGMS